MDMTFDTAIGVRDFARKAFYSDPRNQGATLKNTDLDKMVDFVLEAVEKSGVPIIEVDEGIYNHKTPLIKTLIFRGR